MRLFLSGLPVALAVLIASLPLGRALAADESEESKEAKPLVVEDGRTVAIEYTLKLEDGTTADSNVGREPLVYEHGSQQMLPAFEREVTGMAVDQSREFSLDAEDGYGPVRPELRQEVDAEMVPEEARHEGAQLVSQDPAGNQQLVRVHEVKEDTLVLDLNHPLAGKKLHFDVKVVDID